MDYMEHVREAGCNSSMKATTTEPHVSSLADRLVDTMSRLEVALLNIEAAVEGITPTKNAQGVGSEEDKAGDPRRSLEDDAQRAIGMNVEAAVRLDRLAIRLRNLVE